MTYQYGMKGSPAVGGGLGGIPKKVPAAGGAIADTPGNMPSVVSRKLVSNATNKDDLIYTSAGGGSSYAFSPINAPRGPNPVNLDGDVYQVTAPSVVSGMSSRLPTDHPVVWEPGSRSFWLGGTRFDITSSGVTIVGSGINSSHVGFSGFELLRTSNGDYLAYKSVVGSRDGRAAVTITARRMSSTGVPLTPVIESFYYAGDSSLTSLHTFGKGIRFSESPSGLFIAVMYCSAATTGGTRNGWVRVTLASTVGSSNEFSFSSAFSPENTRGLHFCKTTNVLYLRDGLHGTCHIESHSVIQHSQYYFEYIYDVAFTVYRDNTAVLSGVRRVSRSSLLQENSQLTTAGGNSAAYSWVDETSSQFILRTTGHRQQGLQHPASSRILPTVFGVSVGKSGTGMSFPLFMLPAPRDDQMDSNTTLEVNTNCIFWYYDVQSRKISYIAAVNARQSSSFKPLGFFSAGIIDSSTMKLKELVRVDATNQGIEDSFVSYFFVISNNDNSYHLVFKSSSFSSTNYVKAEYEGFSAGEYRLSGIALDSAASGGSVEVLERGSLMNSSTYGNVNLDFSSCGGRVLLASQNDAVIF